jgi:hypothetical protein
MKDSGKRVSKNSLVVEALTQFLDSIEQEVPCENDYEYGNGKT